MNPTKILIAAWNAILVKGIESVLDPYSYPIVSFEGNADDLLLKSFRFDAKVLIVDADSHERFGAATVKKLKTQYPYLKIIIINIDHRLPDRVKAIMQARAEGCISKYAEASYLVEAVEMVANGKNFLCIKCRQAIVESFMNATSEKKEGLTAQEKKIIDLLAREYHNYEIADKLHIGLRTVETHRKHILKKIGARNLAGIALYALQSGILNL